jgi:hypothetical protein
LLVSPSSRASSYTRMLLGKSCPQPFFVGLRSSACVTRRRNVTRHASRGRKLPYPRTIPAGSTKSHPEVMAGAPPSGTTSAPGARAPAP